MKELIDNSGRILSDGELYSRIHQQENILQELFVVKNKVTKYLRGPETCIAKCIKIKNCTYINNGKKSTL